MVPTKSQIYKLLDDCLDNTPCSKTEGEPSPLWVFCRHAKACPGLGQRDSHAALAVVQNWMLARTVGWADLLGEERKLNEEDCAVAFLDVWDTIIFPAGVSPVDEALAHSQSQPVSLLNPLTFPGYRAFLSYAYWLQRLTTFVEIYLPCHLLSVKFNVSKQTISRYRHFAMNDSFLTQVREHSWEKRSATRFRFALERFDEAGRQTS